MFCEYFLKLHIKINKLIMKKVIVLIFIIAIFSLNSIAQTHESRPLSIDLNAGSRLLSMENATNNYSSAPADLNLSLGVRYMLKDVVESKFFSSLGFKIDGGYDMLTSEIMDGGKTTTNLFRVSGHGILDIDNLLPIGSEKFGLLLHGGSGISYMNNPNAVLTQGRSDRMLNFIAGITPEFRVHENISLNMDVSFIVLGLQDRGVEMEEYLPGAPLDKSWGNNYMNLTVGVSYRFGSKKESIKEVDPVIERPEEIIEHEAEDIIAHKDEDTSEQKDEKVIEQKDEEVIEQKDEEDIKQIEEEHITEIEPEVTEPDTKTAKEIKEEDKSPTEYDLREFDNVLFGFNSNRLSTEDKLVLDDLASYMQSNPKILLTIEGYADCFGSEGNNIIISERRAQSVANYLIQKGIENSRIETKAMGEINLVVPCKDGHRYVREDNTLNRRAELKLRIEE